ncbi:uncharacterized protein LOC144118720 isoform X2 [Amblyomma americanum]
MELERDEEHRNRIEQQIKEVEEQLKQVAEQLMQPPDQRTGTKEQLSEIEERLKQIEAQIMQPEGQPIQTEGQPIQTEDTEEAPTPDAEAPNVPGESPDDAPSSGVCSDEPVVAAECSKKPELAQRLQRSAAEWKFRLQEFFLARPRSPRSASTGGQEQQPTSSQSRGPAFTDGVETPESARSTKPWPPWVADEPRNELEERRAVEADAPFSYTYVRDTLFKYERLDDSLKDVHHEYLKLITWKRPLRTGLLLVVSLFAIWMGCLLQLLLAPAVVYLTTQFTEGRKPIAPKGTKRRKRKGPKHFFKPVTDVVKVMKLDMRVSKTFEEISTVFDKTESLFCWNNAGTSFCFLLTLLSLTLFAFLMGQGVAMQVAVTAILLKVFVVDEWFRRFPHLAAKYDLISHAWNQLPVRVPEDPEQRQQRQQRQERQRRQQLQTRRRRSALDTLLSVADAAATFARPGVTHRC